MLADLGDAGTRPVGAQNFRELRQWKGRETLRIALREVADVAPLEETTAELSQLAEICVTKVLEHWEAELRHRLGSPAAQFAVLALGKLGGRELNHSSDIDVIFLYSEEGQISAGLSYHQWFNRLATKVFETFATKDPAGALFRMDLRLRPEGSAGPVARSLASLENYYAGFGETWERLALIKARFIAGSEELAYDFLREHQPFIYPKTPTPELLDEVAAIKRRIERDIVGYENLERNVKLGTGGIREIEFVVQALQLLHGARHAFLQETSTLKTLPALAELELLPRRRSARFGERLPLPALASNTACRSRRNNRRTPSRQNRKRCPASPSASDSPPAMIFRPRWENTPRASAPFSPGSLRSGRRTRNRAPCAWKFFAIKRAQRKPSRRSRKDAAPFMWLPGRGRSFASCDRCCSKSSRKPWMRTRP